MILKASSPIRHLAFSPSASQPFTLVAACASGTMIRYDVRYVSRQNGGATDRIAGHVGACLAMDWRDGFSCEREPAAASGIGSTAETAGGGREGGWVVTGGVDRTVKIWDFSLPTLSTKPVRTLYTSQPVYSVAWHPTRPTELASSPMPSLGLGAEGSSSSVGDEVPSTPSSAVDSPLAAMIKGDNPAPRARTDRNAWKNEIEVWDVRRPYFPKLSIKTDEPISSASAAQTPLAFFSGSVDAIVDVLREYAVQVCCTTTTRRSGRPRKVAPRSSRSTLQATLTRCWTVSTGRHLPGTSKATLPS